MVHSQDKSRFVRKLLDFRQVIRIVRINTLDFIFIIATQVGAAQARGKTQKGCVETFSTSDRLLFSPSSNQA